MENKVLIADLRKSKGWTQELLAEKTGLSVRTVQRLEAGNDASLETLRIVAEALDVTVSELFEKIGSKSVQQEVADYNSAYTKQINQRRTAESLFNLFWAVYYVALMVVVALFGYFNPGDTDHPIFALIWLAAVLLGLPARRYLKFVLGNRLNEKYPLTASLLVERRPRQKLFHMWWDEKPTRYVVTIFWSTVIPLLFILKFVLHVF